MKALSHQTKLYLYATYVAGITFLIWHLTNLDTSELWLLIGLCVLASISLILKVEGSTNRSHYSFNFLVYGFAFAQLGTSGAIFVIAVSNLVEWIWNKPPWYIQLFNAACYIIVMQAAGKVYAFVNPNLISESWQPVLGILLGMVTFNLLNHLMVGIVVWFARGENFKQSGIFDFFPLMLDLALLLFGSSLSFVWHDNTFALGLFLVPLYLIYSTLRVPALERKTEIDSKTGLFNHEYFKKQISNELNRANRFDRPLAIILADLDLLRNINNTYGHLAGDEVLIEIAKTMKQAVRDYDVVCRFGGEEFAILLPETTIEQAYERAEIIRKKVEALEFTIPTSITPIRATLSLGVAQRENFSQTQDEITHNADLALYHSKLSGRNRCYAYTNDIYMDFSSPTEARLNPAPVILLKEEKATAIPINVEESVMVENPSTKPSPDLSQKASDYRKPQASDKPTYRFKYAVEVFIGGLAILAIAALVIITKWQPFESNFSELDWVGLLAISALIALSEGFSVDLYANRTSVSTSAIPILVAYMLFGIIGVIFASLVLAITLVVKFRSPLNRFIFNLSNHILAGALIIGMMNLFSLNIISLPTMIQIVICLVSAIILYLFTTWMIAVGMSLSLNHPVQQIWQEQYSWLVPYYLGIGLITYTMVFGYIHNHVVGLLLMIVPMALLRISQKQYVDRTRGVVAELREKNQILQQNAQEFFEFNEGLLITLSEIIDLRDPYVLGHSKQVSKYATEIARNLGLNDKQVELIRKAGLLHDIGKLGISMEILTKPGKLTPEEYETIKGHAALGGDIVKNSPSLRSLVPIIRHHHEYYNGDGYPDKLSGNQISIEARVISVADAIEAMTSNRPYRKALKPAQVIEELISNSGTQFDPNVVTQAVKMLQATTMENVTSTDLEANRVPSFPLHVQVTT